MRLHPDKSLTEQGSDLTARDRKKYLIKWCDLVWPWHRIWKVGHVTSTTPPFGQYFIFSFIIPYGQSERKIWGLYLHRSRDIRGSWNLKSRSIDLGHAPFWPIFHLGYWFSILTINPHAKFEVCIFNHSRAIRGSQNLKSRSRDLGHALFYLVFIFFGLVSLTFNPRAKFVVCIFSHSRDIRGPKIWKVGHPVISSLNKLLKKTDQAAVRVTLYFQSCNLNVKKIDAVVCFSKIICHFFLICFKIRMSKISDRTDIQIFVKPQQRILGFTFNPENVLRWLTFSEQSIDDATDTINRLRHERFF